MTNVLLYALIATILYLIFKKEEKTWYIEREDDYVIEVIGGRFILTEKH